MKTMQVGEFKARFSEVLDAVEGGEEVAISFGKKKEKIAVLVPYAKYMRKSPRRLGILEDTAAFSMNGFPITDEELLDS